MKASSLVLALAVSLTSAPAWAQAPSSRFLDPADLDPVLILPPPPADGSPAQVAGLAELHRIQDARTPEQLAQAKHDDELEDVRAIADVLGPPFDLAKFPATARVFADLRREDSAAARRAKADFERNRPWVGDATLSPCSKEDAPKSSYPSGHATMGYAAAVLLSDLIPGNAQVILARAADYAQNRLVCGMHYREDIEAGQVLGTVLVLKLLQKPAFRAEVEAARAELTAVHLAP